MTVTFFSNFFNHHQKPVADELYKTLGDDYTFVATVPMPESFSKAGYTDFSDIPFVLHSYANDENYKKALLLALNSDVVVIGAAPLNFIKERIAKNKLTFRYAERLFKKSKLQKFNPRAYLHQYKNHTIYRNKNLHMLCASAYTANDLKWLFAYPNKMYKWGYFTKSSELNIAKILALKNKEKFRIIFVARLIDWKHPEMALGLAKLLKEKNYNFEINIVGSGVMEQQLKSGISQDNLEDCVTLLGNLPNEKVLQLIQKAHAYFFSSDRNEGWGAVANEAMANGATLVASHEIGAIPYLIEPNIDGLVFESGNISDAFKKIEALIKDPIFCSTLSKNAFEKINTTWSPNNAANAFLQLAEEHLKKQNNSITNGPCSLAQATKNKWFKK